MSAAASTASILSGCKRSITSAPTARSNATEGNDDWGPGRAASQAANEERITGWLKTKPRPSPWSRPEPARILVDRALRARGKSASGLCAAGKTPRTLVPIASRNEANGRREVGRAFCGRRPADADLCESGVAQDGPKPAPSAAAVDGRGCASGEDNVLGFSVASLVWKRIRSLAAPPTAAPESVRCRPTGLMLEAGLWGEQCRFQRAPRGLLRGMKRSKLTSPGRIASAWRGRAMADRLLGILQLPFGRVMIRC
jgi:hypothetical protein